MKKLAVTSDLAISTEQGAGGKGLFRTGSRGNGKNRIVTVHIDNFFTQFCFQGEQRIRDMAITKKTTNSKYWRGWEEKGALVNCW